MEGSEEKSAVSAGELALSVLTLARNTLTVNFRFLSRALSALTLTESETPWFASDGRRLYFEPWYVLGQYKAERFIMTRDYLHTVLHCVFRHGFVGKGIDVPRWDLACDIAVENMINGLAAPCLAAERARRQVPVIETIRAEVPELSAERIYKWLGEKKLTEQELHKLRLDFLADEHGLWYGAAADPNAKSRDVDLEVLWQEVSKRMQTELETMTEDKSSPLVQSLRRLNRAKHDYGSFLRRFGVWGEAMRISDEEFDYNYYTYGLSLYGNLPLVEPLEYREERRIRDFVIAVDTSGSVKGELVQSFIQHTYDILRQRESFFTKLRLHVLQCDDRIREDALLQSAQELEDYISGMEIKGLGKTDFRPVFAYVEELLASHELSDLRGLLYFTDGKGVYPEKKPPYETAFILHGDEAFDAPVPPWAIRLEITEDEILDRRF